MELLEWPARSPEFNSIENVWASLARVVHAGGKQYTCVMELTAAVQLAWGAIDSQALASLIASMPDRCIETIEKVRTKHFTKYI